MKLNSFLKKNKIIILLLVVVLFLSSCSNTKTAVIKLNPDSTKLAKPIKEALQKNSNLILSVGTGLCENCKIVENTLNAYKLENNKNVDILIYTDYTDRDTFQELNITISPTTFFINKDHEIVNKVIGLFKEADLKKYLKEAGFTS
jgi:hypothetical protein